MRIFSVSLLAVLVVAVCLVVWFVMRHPAPRSGTARLGASIVAGVPPTPAARALLERWRDRAMRWRLYAGLPAVLGAIAAGLVTEQQIRVGVGDAPPWTDPLLVGLLGSFLGALAAEMHRVRPTPGRQRSASLEPREVADHLPPGARNRSAVLAALAAAALVAGAVLEGPATLAPGVAALVVLGLVPWAQNRIVTRPRPGLHSDLEAADAAVRRLAVRGVDDAGAGAALLLVAWQTSPAFSRGPALLGVLGTVLVLGAFVLAVVWWRRSAPARLLPDVGGALGAHDAEPAA